MHYLVMVEATISQAPYFTFMIGEVYQKTQDTTWLQASAEIYEKLFAETGKLWEKYDVVKGTIGRSGHYKTQPGFGWTNMLYVKLQHMLFKLER